MAQKVDTMTGQTVLPVMQGKVVVSTIDVDNDGTIRRVVLEYEDGNEVTIQAQDFGGRLTIHTS